MRRLQRPPDSALQTFRTCVQRIRNENLRKRLLSIDAEIAGAAAQFDSASIAASLHTLPEQNDIHGIVSGTEMVDVYDVRMAKKKSAGRSLYDKLLTSPAYGHCPLCGHRIVSTLDHHMPKTRYIGLVVTPTNLVPSCSDCNKAKGDIRPSIETEQTLHPYFDDVEDDLWLHAQVAEVTPAALRFFVQAPQGWSAVRTARVTPSVATQNRPMRATSKPANDR